MRAEALADFTVGMQQASTLGEGAEWLVVYGATYIYNYSLDSMQVCTGAPLGDLPPLRTHLFVCPSPIKHHYALSVAWTLLHRAGA